MFIVIHCRAADPEPNILFGATTMKKLKNSVYMVKIVRNLQLLMNFTNYKYLNFETNDYLRSLKIIQEYHRAKPRHRWGYSIVKDSNADLTVGN